MRKPLNMTSLAKNYGECYVARSIVSGEVIAHGKNPQVLITKIKNKEDFKKKKIVISWIPKYGTQYVFGVSFLLCRS